MDNINIVMASDNNYAQHLGVAIISILENSSNKETLFFHIIENNISEQNVKNLNSIKEKYKTNIKFYSLDETDTKNLPEIGHLSKATYFRLFIADILPKEIKKIIYLDCDIIVLKDINLLYRNNLQHHAIGVIKDVKSEEIKRIYFYPDIKFYFNAGVLLINLDIWRKINLKNKALSFIEKYYQQLSTADQDVLNCLFKDDYLELPRIFNHDPKHEKINASLPLNTVILHYSDKIKPWSYLYIGKNKKYYFKYLTMSPWNNVKYKDKNLKNFFNKYIIAGNKIIKNFLRPVMPKNIIDLNKKIFLKKIQKNLSHKI